MDNKKLNKLAILCLIIGVVLLVVNYFFFHYVTDTGIVTIKQEEAGKPFVAELIGDLAVLFLFASAFIELYKVCKK